MTSLPTIPATTHGLRLRLPVVQVGSSAFKPKTMKSTQVLAAIVAVTLPFAIVSAEDAAKPDSGDQKNEQNSNQMEMMGMNKGQMMSSWKDQDAELDKLITAMNDAPPDKKVDAIAAVLTKLVEQRKAMHEQMQAMMAANMKAQMNMCRMMMGMMGMMGMKMDGNQGDQGDTNHVHHQ
jgi:hypothetical protein